MHFYVKLQEWPVFPDCKVRSDLTGNLEKETTKTYLKVGCIKANSCCLGFFKKYYLVENVKGFFKSASMNQTIVTQLVKSENTLGWS